MLQPVLLQELVIVIASMAAAFILAMLMKDEPWHKFIPALLLLSLFFGVISAAVAGVDLMGLLIGGLLSLVIMFAGAVIFFVSGMTGHVILHYAGIFLMAAGLVGLIVTLALYGVTLVLSMLPSLFVGILFKHTAKFI